MFVHPLFDVFDPNICDRSRSTELVARDVSQLMIMQPHALALPALHELIDVSSERIRH